VLTWQELGLTGISAPEKTGFGTQLIRKSLKASGGEASIEYLPEGIKATIEFLVSDEEDITPEKPLDETIQENSMPPAPLSAFDGLNILLVEDEAIVAMDLELKLEQLGFVIVGLASTIGEAEDILERMTPDLALLDANLHGQKVDHIARTLADRKIPFAFSTGYGREALPEDLRDVEILAKPFSDARMINVLARLAGEALARQDKIPSQR